MGEMDGQSVDGRVLSVCFAQLARKSGSEMVGNCLLSAPRRAHASALPGMR